MKTSSKKYRIIYSRKAEKDILSFDKPIRKRILKKIEFYSKDPFAYMKGLTNIKEIGSYRWRIGSYRVPFDVRKGTIEILRIKRRESVYKK